MRKGRDFVTLTENNVTFGNKASPLHLVEFMDFQCPACRFYSGPIKKLFDEMSEDIQFSLFHFPLNIHKHAVNAAVYACCAWQQDKFWEMSDLLLENQGALEENYLNDYAEKAKLDGDQLDKCLSEETCLEQVRQDRKTGDDLKIRGTPSLFINGHQLDHIPTVDELKVLLIKLKKESSDSE